MGEGVETEMGEVNPHILKHHIPEHPSGVFTLFAGAKQPLRARLCARAWAAALNVCLEGRSAVDKATVSKHVT